MCTTIDIFIQAVVKMSIYIKIYEYNKKDTKTERHCYCPSHRVKVTICGKAQSC